MGNNDEFIEFKEDAEYELTLTYGEVRRARLPRHRLGPIQSKKGYVPQSRVRVGGVPDARGEGRQLEPRMRLFEAELRDHRHEGGERRLGEGGGESRPFALQWGGYPKGGYINGDSREEAVGAHPVREQFAHALRRAGRPNLRVHQGVRLHEPHPHRRGGDDHRGSREGKGRDEARDGVRPVHRAKRPHEGPEEGLRHRRQQDGIERRMGR